MSHSCCQLTIDEFFRGREEFVPLYRALLRFLRENGPVTVNVNKTRISFQRRVRFATVSAVTRAGFVCTFWLKRRISDPRLRVEFLPPANYIYRFTLNDPRELDDQLRLWMAESYRVGQQRQAG